MNNKQVLPC